MRPAGAVDAHVHLWRYTAAEFDWIDDGMGALRRDFGMEDWRAAVRGTGVTGAVLVQARQTVEESAFLLEVAERSPEVLGVVGWVPLVEAGVETELERLAARPKFKGVRHVVQAEPAGFLLREDVNRGLEAVTRAGLTYDLLLRADQVREATVCVDRHPGQRFVVDHVAKPGIAAGAGTAEFAEWAGAMRELARRENVWCKLSGMVTEADWRAGGRGWTVEELRPFAEVVLEAWGPARVMWGSDWPVVTVAAEYGAWVEAAEGLLGRLSATEQERVWGGTAREFYRLGV